MKKLLYILIIPFSLLLVNCGEEELQPATYVPDYYFEQELINLGLDDVLDDYVLTGNINDLKALDISDLEIEDLTGIEDFTSLTSLNCFQNQLTSLNLRNNTALTNLHCASNQLTSLNVSNNTALTNLHCGNNQLTSLDVSYNTSLTTLLCSGNSLTSLDISNNTALTYLQCIDSQLTSLDVRNGNNTNVTYFRINSNPGLSCINVDNAAWSTSNWIGDGWTFTFDNQHYFSEDCP